MADFRSMARDPEHRRDFEKLLYLAAERGDADLVAERLSWGVDPNCAFAKGRTPLIANVRGSCPSAATVRALLGHGAGAGWGLAGARRCPRLAGRTRPTAFGSRPPQAGPAASPPRPAPPQ